MNQPRGRILLADDEATFLSSTADLLRREGFECVTVADGREALAQASQGEFDLLITDLEMPGNSDLELVRRIAESSGGLPVIIQTGYPSVRSAIACVELPVAAYLIKPVQQRQLREALTEIVRGGVVVIDHGWGVYTAYDHLSEILVQSGDMVQPGQVIGLGGATGRTTGPHLHYEFLVNGRPRNPRPRDAGNGQPVAAAQREQYAATRAQLLGQLDPPVAIATPLPAAGIRVD